MLAVTTDNASNNGTLLRPKRVPWKQLMLNALKAGKQKLSDYYAETDRVSNDLYAISTVMAPQNKFQFFKSKEWDPYRDEYRESLKDYLKPYQQQLMDAQLPTQAQASKGQGTELDMILEPEESQQLT
ncbi:hypothetical protein NUU61_007020 [Penicillium alfredii]|uniref:Uncharacterized protein n=1 Tax=Penicillium alfredii TaxID=1506179 RepID=A0A9W9F209_9EURO|nr:uncharacterized protein NUU61_007020 [Penicillium alfredii]KAJ5092150.1 hypothetical protein NUU61_007020 [Penicillium alfredii]